MAAGLEVAAEAALKISVAASRWVIVESMMRSADTRTIGDAAVSFVGAIRSLEGRDFNGNPVSGAAQRFRIALPAEPSLVADVVTWARRSADEEVGHACVRFLEGREQEGSPRNYSHRMGIYRHPCSTPQRPMLAQELRLIGPKKDRPDQTTLRMATLEEIEAAARVRGAEQILGACGADTVGTRKRLGWSAGKRDNQLAMTFEQSSLWAPIAALVLCVVLPVFHGSG